MIGIAITFWTTRTPSAPDVEFEEGDVLLLSAAGGADALLLSVAGGTDNLRIK